MKLTDREILELNELANGAVDETLTERQKARLADVLRKSEEARRFYVRVMGLSASLYSYAGEMQAEAPDARPKIVRMTFRSLLGLAAAVAAVVVGVVAVRHPKPDDVPAEPRMDESVAQLTGSKDCQWAAAAPLQPGDHLRKGQLLELVSGFAEVTFDSGAEVVLEGPVALELNSAWETTLQRGALKASVPQEARGFRIASESVDVVDLGTEFTMIAEAGGAADVLVLKGAVEAAPQNSADEQTVLIRENQARRFAQTGISPVDDSGEKFKRYTQPVQLDRFAPLTRYAHWSFDETDGRMMKADTAGHPLEGFEVRLSGTARNNPSRFLTDGPWRKALKFDGRLFAKASVPGISGNSPRTVAFWVRVPEDTWLSDAYAMVAWRANSTKLGARPVHISWNRNPTEGTVGVLRTDYGGGYALGATPLRDGRWHYLTIVFVPGEEADTPVQVKQYVDGRLEGEGNPSSPGRRGSAMTPSAEEITTVTDTIWLGCRLGGNGQRRERFRGEMDELFIADRALGPREILQLMKDNQPPQSELAARN